MINLSSYQPKQIYILECTHEPAELLVMVMQTEGKQYEGSYTFLCLITSNENPKRSGPHKALKFASLVLHWSYEANVANK